MSFLLPTLSILGQTLLPKAISWIGRKLNGTALGNTASHIIRQNPNLIGGMNQIG